MTSWLKSVMSVGAGIGAGRAGPLLPCAVPLHLRLQIAHRAEVLVEAVAVAGADLAFELAGTVLDEIEDAAADAQLVHAAAGFRGASPARTCGGIRPTDFSRRGASPRSACRTGRGGLCRTCRMKEGKRVCTPMRSAASWSSETLLRKEPLAGCGRAGQEHLLRRVPAVDIGDATRR